MACECGIESQSLFGGGIRLGNNVTWITAKAGKHGIGIHQSCVCHRITGVSIDGLIEVENGRFDVGVRAFVPGVAPPFT